MAILGQEGRLVMRREAPKPVAIPANASVPGTNSLMLLSQDWWTGDEVNLYSPNGLPLSLEAAPDGVAMYSGGSLAVGSNRDHIADNDDTFYASDPNPFYLIGDPVTCAKAFIHRDQLNRISFYPTRRDAFQGNPSGRIALLNLDYEYLIVSASPVIDPAELGVDAAAGLGTSEVLLPDACTNSGAFQPVDGFLWYCQADLREWTLELDANSVDTTCVGSKFGDSVKSFVNGGGNCDFYIDRRFQDENSESQDGTTLMRLLMLCEKGAKASAKFYLFKDRESGGCDDLAPGSLYYEADILITNLAINVRIDDAIIGTARWVTTGEIRLKMG